jgi:hypothetical protein
LRRETLTERPPAGEVWGWDSSVPSVVNSHKIALPDLVSDPNATGFYGPGSYLGTPIAFVGTWDANALRRLTYDIDTTSGTISNISLEGSTANYAFLTNLFAGVATNYVGMNTSSGVGFTFGAFDNFSLVAIPEPSSIIAWIVVFLVMAGCAWRHKRACRTATVDID